MDNDIRPKSRTQEKKEAHNLQILGEKLTSLTKQQLQAIDIPQEVKEAVTEAASIRSNQAKRRQIQYIGALMRHIDPEPVIHALSMIEAGLDLKSPVNNEKTDWAESLVSGDDQPFEAILSRFPGTDRQKLSQLIRNARKNHGGPKATKSYKQLRDFLVKLV